MNYLTKSKAVGSCLLNITRSYRISPAVGCSPRKEDAETRVKLADSQTSVGAAIPLGKKVKEATTTAWYSAVVLAGIGVTAGVLYFIFRELLSGQSPQAIYSKSLDRCTQNGRVCDLLGEPIRGHGEENSRGRRRHVSYVEFVQEGVQRLRMNFYIVGTRRKAKAFLEMHKNDNGTYEYDYLIVETQGYPRETVIVEDNRKQANLALQ